jgi:hypothetical protein
LKAFIADRKAEQRRPTLQEIQRQIEARSLTARNMTAEERKALPAATSETAPQVTTSFLGGVEEGGGEGQAADDACVGARESRFGCPAESRWIFKSDCRLDGLDCEIQIGKRLRSGEGVVVAILDHGPRRFCRAHRQPGEIVVRVGRHVYAVTKFA